MQRVTVAVTEDQFELIEGAILHRPTSAEFFFYPRHDRPFQVNWGNAGVVLEDGTEYQKQEVEETATRLIDLLMRVGADRARVRNQSVRRQYLRNPGIEARLGSRKKR